MLSCYNVKTSLFYETRVDIAHFLSKKLCGQNGEYFQVMTEKCKIMISPFNAGEVVCLYVNFYIIWKAIIT